jgi:AcrR family transcriptional regulator
MEMTRAPASPAAEGWRDRKRRLTAARIAETGLRLFVEQGFEATTLDAIAAAAGIARRTFFHYFDSKEALLFAYEERAEQGMRAALDGMPTDMPPFEAMRGAVMTMVSEFGTEETRIFNKLLRSTEALRARKQANYARQERFLLTTLREKWPDPSQALPLSLVAMIGIGTLRIAADAWSAEGGVRPLRAFLEDSFAALPDQPMGGAPP